MNDLVPINNLYVSASTSLLYMPLVGATAEQVTPGAIEVAYTPNNKVGRLLEINIKSSSAMGSTIFTIYDNNAAAVIGTKTVTLAGVDTIQKIDFTQGLDSGTNVFDGVGTISVGVDVATAANNVFYSIIFERGIA